MARFVKALAAVTLLIGFGGWLTAATSSLLLDGPGPMDGGSGSLRSAAGALFSAVYGTSSGDELGPLGLAVFCVCVLVGAIMVAVAGASEGDDVSDGYDAEET